MMPSVADDDDRDNDDEKKRERSYNARINSEMISKLGKSFDAAVGISDAVILTPT